jgi:hypothetical protein
MQLLLKLPSQLRNPRMRIHHFNQTIDFEMNPRRDSARVRTGIGTATTAIDERESERAARMMVRFILSGVPV